MQKEPKSIIISKLRERGCRITRQRRIILDIILDEDCSCCKEIYYKACKQDPSIGAATVYRMVNTLEEIGVISRKNMYKYTGNEDDEEMECVPCCRMELDDGTVLQLSDRKFRQVLTCGLESCGYMTGKRIVSIRIIPDRLPSPPGFLFEKKSQLEKSSCEIIARRYNSR